MLDIAIQAKPFKYGFSAHGKGCTVIVGLCAKSLICKHNIDHNNKTIILS